MITNPGLALIAAAITAGILLARWWATPRNRRRSRIRMLRLPWNRTAAGPSHVPRHHPHTLDHSAQQVVREAEQLLSRQWNLLRPLYPRHPDRRPPNR